VGSMLKNNGILRVNNCMYVYLKINSLEHDNTQFKRFIIYSVCGMFGM
jgi:hypothetical protein